MSTDTFRPRLPDIPPPSRSARDRRWWYVAAVVAVAALVVLALVLVRGADDPEVVAPPVSTPSAAPSEPAAPSPSPSAEAPDPAVDRSTAVWPFAGSALSYDDPVEAARSFATDYLGFSGPVVGAFEQGDSRSGEVAVRPRANGPVTTVLLRQLTGENAWSVLGATSASISVTEPSAGAAIGSPVTVRGSALAFEGTVQVQVREDGVVTPLGTGFVTGGGDQMRPFEGSIAFDPPSLDFGALVLTTHSAEDGQVWEAAVLRVRLTTGGAQPAACGSFSPQQPALGPGQMQVTVFFTCDPQQQATPSTIAVFRSAPQSSGVLRASMTALLEGPTAQEESAGITSWFSSETAGMLRGVDLDDGHAVVDFADLREVIPNASTSAGSALLLSELDATALQFPTVTSVEYRIEGSCAAFTEWVQLGGCAPRTR